MNKTNKIKTKAVTRTLPTAAVLILLTRILSIVVFSVFAYLTSDPGANIFTASLICKATCDLICGFITAKSIGKDFSLGTRLFFALTVTVLLNIAEMFLGKAVFPSGETAFYMIPISAASAFLGAFASKGKKSVKRYRRKKR